MRNLRILSSSEQLAGRLREGIGAGDWIGLMPGEAALAKELGVEPKMVGRALRQLEEEGLLESRGERRRRKIASTAGLPGTRSGPLRLALLGGAANHRKSRFLGDLPYQLSAAGHQAFYAKRSTVELGGNISRLSRMVAETAADAWVVFSGRQDVLEWFAHQPKPVISVWGRHHGLEIASTEPDRSGAYAELTRCLIGLGHRRIVLMARYGQRQPTPGQNEQAFLDELEANGIAVSNYQLPEWKETPDGYQEVMRRLFRLTPPTAIIVDDAVLFTVTLQLLIGHGLRVPEDVSLACTEYETGLDWCRPPVSHIRCDRDEMCGHVLKWAKRIAGGKRDVRTYSCAAEFVRGGTIGPARGK